MTPNVTAVEKAARHLYDPLPGSIHIMNLTNMAKDGMYCKDKLSDHLIGLLLIAKDLKIISAWEGTLFQLPLYSI
jgi:hypothetical protein